jgi:ADP-ribose pyrophosphatase
MKNPKAVKIIKEDVVYQDFLQVRKFHLQHELFEGGMSDTISREVLTKSHIVAVLPYDPIRDEVVIIEQFRAGALASENPWLIEIVAGIADADETIEQLAHREVQEEAGLTIEALIPFYTYWVSPGASNELVHLFCAKIDSSHAGGIHGCKGEHEDIRVSVISSHQAFEYVRTGKIINSLSIIALQWLELHRDELIKKWRV